ncbi:hypothetical protein B0J18DRAFT_192925 [Chaetomium sp. MPI-SDFR-AT-0129]|nr:hypothetical protein B0J18DRAFT_192925 [Chaetomium sp. MPI-SDFR-AT-0129]
MGDATSAREGRSRRGEMWASLLGGYQTTAHHASSAAIETSLSSGVSVSPLSKIEIKHENWHQKHASSSLTDRPFLSVISSPHDGLRSHPWLFWGGAATGVPPCAFLIRLGAASVFWGRPGVGLHSHATLARGFRRWCVGAMGGSEHLVGVSPFWFFLQHCAAGRNHPLAYSCSSCPLAPIFSFLVFLSFFALIFPFHLLFNTHEWGNHEKKRTGIDLRVWRDVRIRWEKATVFFCIIFALARAWGHFLASHRARQRPVLRGGWTRHDTSESCRGYGVSYSAWKLMGFLGTISYFLF